MQVQSIQVAYTVLTKTGKGNLNSLLPFLTGITRSRFNGFDLSLNG